MTIKTIKPIYYIYELDQVGTSVTVLTQHRWPYDHLCTCVARWPNDQLCTCVARWPNDQPGDVDLTPIVLTVTITHPATQNNSEYFAFAIFGKLCVLYMSTTHKKAT